MTLDDGEFDCQRLIRWLESEVRQLRSELDKLRPHKPKGPKPNMGEGQPVPPEYIGSKPR